MRPATSPGEGQARAKSKNDMTGEKQDTRIPGLVREQNFGGVDMRFIGHMRMQWHMW